MADGGPRAQWAPVVYGRTRRVDRWWRAVPRDVDERWLESLVMAVVAGGRRLVDPRFLFARGRDDALIGVACRARVLSNTMHSDGSRELYCFVGWWSTVWFGGVDTPSLADFKDGYRQWAAEEYERWMAPDWDRPARDLQRPHRTPSRAAPWPSAAPPVPPSTRYYQWYSQLYDRSAAWPSSEASSIWDQARASSHPIAVSVGWQVASDPLGEDVVEPFHVVVASDDVEPFELEFRQRLRREAEERARRQQQEERYRREDRVEDRPPRDGGLKGKFKSLLSGRPSPSPQTNEVYGDDYDEHDPRRRRQERRKKLPPAAPPQPRPTYRPPILPPSHDPQRAAKIDRDFTFDEPARSTVPEPEASPRPLGSSPAASDTPRPLDLTPPPGPTDGELLDRITAKPVPESSEAVASDLSETAPSKAVTDEVGDPEPADRRDDVGDENPPSA